MLNIRREQIGTLGRAAAAAFEAEMVAYCYDFSPQVSKSLGDEQLRAMVGSAIDRASDYGFTNRGPARFFIEMCFTFGSSFDTDPQYPWAAELLKSREEDSQMERAERLYKKTVHYLEHVAGPDGAFTGKALERISALSRQPPVFSTADYVPSLMREIERAYPEKAAYVGSDALESLLREGVHASAAHGMVSAQAVRIYCWLMFMFGHGCADDPLYPWIARTLNDEKSDDPAERALRLEKKALTWLDHVITSFAGETST
jgi:hypothetical protein